MIYDAYLAVKMKRHDQPQALNPGAEALAAMVISARDGAVQPGKPPWVPENTALA